MARPLTEVLHNADGRGGHPPRLFFLASLLLGAVGIAGAAVIKMDRAQLLQAADLVVCGLVKDLDAAGYAVVSVEDVLKGQSAAGESIRVRFSAGMSESPIFESGERVLLFLHGVSPGEFVTVGGFQGKVVPEPGECCALRD